MSDWHKWTERKPTEADARGNYIEWYDSIAGARFIQPLHYSPYPNATGMYWRTPTPLLGEESAARHCGCGQKKGCFSCGMESGPAVADVDETTAPTLTDAEIEAIARRYCLEMGVDPDAGFGTPGADRVWWKAAAIEVRDRLAWKIALRGYGDE